MKKILLIGSGGREHAFARLLTSQPGVHLFIAPGNAGTAQHGENIPLTDIDDLVAFARQEDVDYVVVGPEQPLVEGIANRYRAVGIPVVGPDREAARLEGSKVFAKQFMQRYGIPTAAYRVFTAEEQDAARRFIHELGAPVVVKADGLAAGKGAVVCRTIGEAEEALDAMLVEARFGAAGRRVVVEEFMEGEEASLFVLTNGEQYTILAPAQDHKAIGEGDTGPNTGGMGAYAPAPVMTEELVARTLRDIVEPTLEGMWREGSPYRGILYCGLMITKEGPKVVEFNCRLGDPEAQVVLPLLESPEVLEALAHGRIPAEGYITPSRYAACVVMASAGYPGPYEKGKRITGVEEAEAMEHVHVYHAGTRRGAGGELLTAGGRVLGVTGLGDTLDEAIRRAYEGIGRITFEGAYYRRDIGARGLRRLQTIA